ncbi:MAG TPA: trigger factor [Balneolales bacterium]|nr:trigger factor [Balneolales bacterium]
MDISVEELSPVDRKIKITADRKDLKDTFEKAYRRYRKMVTLPGFRPGQVPVGMIKKRFGKEIEAEEIQKYLTDLYNKEILPKHQPIGEPDFEAIKWEDDQLEAELKIGVEPEFELIEPKDIAVDMLVHDVTDEDVDKEIEHMLSHEAKWVETDESSGEKSQVTFDATALDEEGNPKEDDTDMDQKVNLENVEDDNLKSALIGKKVGETVDADLGSEKEPAKFRILIKKVETKEIPELSEEIIKKQSNGEAEDEDSFRGYMKSRIQDYYDQTAKQLAQQQTRDEYVKKQEFDVPQTLVERILNGYVEQVKNRYGDRLPADFEEEKYKEENKERAVNEAKWFFISEKLEKKYEIEVEEDDLDEFLAQEAKQYGLDAASLKQIYAGSGDMLNQLRLNIRGDKLMKKLLDEVSLNEMDKDAFQKKHNKNSEE